MRLFVEADGGSRGNPGIAGYGALVKDADTGRVLRELAEPLGKASNNVAEYRGLIAGLEAALELSTSTGHAVDVTARMDSKLVVEQMSGRWKVKHEDMKVLCAQARELVADIGDAGGRVSFQWIPRAQNGHADRLSNDAMDGKSIDRRPSEPTAPPAQGSADSEADQEQTQVRAGTLPRPTRAAAGVQRGPGVRVVLVRHAVTEHTVAGVIGGRGGTDPGLGAEGTRQAAATAAGVRDFLGAELSPVVVAGEIACAHQTAQHIGAAFGVGVTKDPAWDEQAMGDWDGQRIGRLATEQAEEVRRWRSDAQFARPGGEAFADVRSRVHDAMVTLRDGDSPVVVVTHRGPIMAVLMDALQCDLEHAWRFSMAPASLTSLRVWPDGAAQIEFINDTHHLRR